MKYTGRKEIQQLIISTSVLVLILDNQCHVTSILSMKRLIVITDVSITKILIGIEDVFTKKEVSFGS